MKGMFLSESCAAPRYSVRTGRLDNGLHVLHYETGSRVAYAALLVGVGSRDEGQQEHGLSHLLEHMLFKGTTRRTAFQIASRLEEVGGEFNAYTAKEETVVHAAFLPRYLKRSLDLLADLVLNPSFPPRELSREREVILDEISSYADSPSEQIYEDFEEMAFVGHGLGHGILGTRRSVLSLGRESLYDYMQRHYRGPRMCVATSGPFAFDQVYGLASRLFSGLPGGDAEVTGRSHFASSPAVCRAVRRRTAQRHCLVGAHTCGFQDRGLVTISLLANFLGGAASTSRLNRAMRERSGLAYNVDCTLSSYAETGLLLIYFGTDPQHTSRAFSVLWRELERARSSPLTARSLDRAKRQYVGQFLLGSESVEGLLLSNARQLVDGMPLTTVQDHIAQIESVTPEEFQETARRVLSDEKLFTLTYH